MTCNVFLPGYLEMSHVSISFQSQFKLKLPSGLCVVVGRLLAVVESIAAQTLV